MEIIKNKEKAIKILKTSNQKMIIDLLNNNVNVVDIMNNFDDDKLTITTLKKDGKNTNYNIIKYYFNIKRTAKNNTYIYNYVLILLEYGTIQKDSYKFIKIIKL